MAFLRGPFAAALLALVALLSACGPDLSGLSVGDTVEVAAAEGPTRVRLADGRLVFLAEVHAPEGATRNAEEALAAMSAGRTATLAFGPRRAIALRGGAKAPLAHVFVRSEGGRWLWAQGELVAAGLVVVRPRPGEAARAAALLALEAEARAARRGVWDLPEHQPRSLDVLMAEAPLLPDACRRGPYRLVEGIVAHAAETASGVYLNFGPPGTEQEDATVRIPPESKDAWQAMGFDAEALVAVAIRARGPTGVRGGPLVCLEHPAALERLEALP
jgi:endonuclease YncB( thermonuclease family)